LLIIVIYSIGCIYSIALGIMHMRGVDLTNLVKNIVWKSYITVGR
jgi:hypothetical protein